MACMAAEHRCAATRVVLLMLQVFRFLLPHGGCGYGQLDAQTAAAIRPVLLAAGFNPVELKVSLGHT